MKLVKKQVAKLKVDWNKVKNHSPEQIEALKASIAEFGHNKPLVIGTDNQVLAGAGVLMALTEMDVKTVDCVDVSHLTEDQQFAFILADNKLAERSSWEMVNVAEIIQSLKVSDYDLSLTAFDAGELNALSDGDLSWMGESISGSNSESTAPSKSSEGYSSIEFVVPVEKKSKILERIRDVRDRMECGTDGEALIMIIESYGG